MAGLNVYLMRLRQRTRTQLPSSHLKVVFRSFIGCDSINSMSGNWR